MKKGIPVVITFLFVMVIFSVWASNDAKPTVASSVYTDVLNVDLEYLENNLKGTNVTVKMMDTSSSIKKVDVKEEALSLLEKKGANLTWETPKVTMIFGPQAFKTKEWAEAKKTGDPLSARVLIEKGDMTKITNNFDEWYYSQLGYSRLTEVSYDITAEVFVGGKKEYELSQFAVPVTVKVRYPVDISNTSINEDNLGFYLLNENTLKWDSVGGKVDKENRIITFQTDRTGLFIVLSNKNKKQISDIGNHWAKGDIQFMMQQNVVQVDSQGKFYPNQGITRADFTCLLVRTLNLTDNSQGKNPFKDISSAKPYYHEVLTAANAGLVSGLSDSRFAPDEKITREQMAAMITRALTYKKLSGSSNKEVLKGFSDQSRIASWARESVATVVNSGLIGGRANKLFAPKAFTTRAEAVVILHRLYNLSHK